MPLRRQLTLYAVLVLAWLFVANPDLSAWLPNVVPVPSVGPRQVLIIRESADDSPDIGRVLVALRNGEPAAYLKAKGHGLLILDDDAKGPDGQPSATVAKFAPFPVLPVLIVSDPATDKVTLREPLPKDAAGVLDLIKKGGG